MNYRYLFFIFFLSLFVNISNAYSFEEKCVRDSSIQNLSYILPKYLKPFETKTQVSMVLTRLPFDWFETSENTFILKVGSKIGLPARFSIETGIQTAFYSTLMRCGPKYNLQWQRFSLDFGVEASYMFYYKAMYGFSNKAYGWSAYPSIAIGYYGNDLAITITGESNYMLSNTMKSEDVEIKQNERKLTGRSIGIYIEQKIHRNCVLTFGLVNSFQKSFFTAWPGSTTFDRFYYVPQIYLGVVL